MWHNGEYHYIFPSLSKIRLHTLSLPQPTVWSVVIVHLALIFPSGDVVTLRLIVFVLIELNELNWEDPRFPVVYAVVVCMFVSVMTMSVVQYDVPLLHEKKKKKKKGESRSDTA